MARHNRKRAVFATTSDTPLPKRRKRRKGVGWVHRNSTAARKWKRDTWRYAGEP